MTSTVSSSNPTPIASRNFMEPLTPKVSGASPASIGGSSGVAGQIILCAETVERGK